MTLAISPNDLELLNKALLLLEEDLKKGMKCSLSAVDPESCRRTLSEESCQYWGLLDLRSRLSLITP